MIQRSNGNSLQAGFEQIFEKKTLSEFCFLTKNALTLMVSLILKVNLCEQKNHANVDESEVVLCRNKILLRESDGVVGCPCSSKGPKPLLILQKGTVDHSCYIKNVLPLAL